MRIFRSARRRREAILAALCALIETIPTGIRVEMNSSAQRAMPNASHALANQLTKLLGTPVNQADDLLESLGLDMKSTRRQRYTLRKALCALRRRRQFSVLYRVIRDAEEAGQLHIHSTMESGHVCRIVTNAQDRKARQSVAV